MKKLLTCLIAAVMLFSLVSCGKVKTHETEEAYRELFYENDDEDAKNLKNMLIDGVIAYNEGNYKAYFSQFDMEESDLDYNINNAKEMNRNLRVTYEITKIETAFVNPENAQALVTLRSKAVDRNTDEILYYISTVYTYTMQIRKDQWVILFSEEGPQIDVEDLEQLTSAE